MRIFTLIFVCLMTGCTSIEDQITIYGDIKPTAKDPIDVRVVYRGRVKQEEE